MSLHNDFKRAELIITLESIKICTMCNTFVKIKIIRKIIFGVRLGQTFHVVGEPIDARS